MPCESSDLRRLRGLVFIATAAVAAQLGPGPPRSGSRRSTVPGASRAGSDEVVAALKLQQGQTVADIGAGSGLLEVPLAKAVGPRGHVYAVEIDAGFFPEIRKRTAAAQVTNVETVLGKFTDPALPVKSIDVAIFHDVIHHVENRPAYIKELAGYLAPAGRIVVIDYEGGKGPHREQPELEVTREQLTGWMRNAGFAQAEDVKMFPDKYFLAFARK